MNTYKIEVNEKTYRKFCKIAKWLNEPDASTAFDNVCDMAIDVVNMRSVQERRRLLKDAIKPNNCEMCGVDKNVSLCWCIK